MRLLGTIEFIYRNKLIVVKSVDKKIVFKLGYKVYGPDLSVIGKVIDVLGPLKEPRILVKPFKEFAKIKENTKVYYNQKELIKR